MFPSLLIEHEKFWVHYRGRELYICFLENLEGWGSQVRSVNFPEERGHNSYGRGRHKEKSERLSISKMIRVF